MGRMYDTMASEEEGAFIKCSLIEMMHRLLTQGVICLQTRLQENSNRIRVI